jgi:quinol monooxygenase YgiN
VIHTRREFVGGAALALLATMPRQAKGGTVEQLYGLIGEMKAVPGRRAELVACLLEGSGEMPGNLAYIVAEDLSNEDSIWVTEVWQTRADHANSLSLPAVQEAIAKARPLIVGFANQVETRPVRMTK